MKRHKFFLMLFILSVSAASVFSQTIHEVILEGDLNKVKNIVAQDPSALELTNDNEKSCLHFAAQAGFFEIVEYLIQKGADVNSKNIADETPLHYAAALGHKNVAEILISHKADINTENYDKNTPLHYAAQFGRPEMIRLLIEKGADVNRVNILDYTPLDYALLLNNEDMVQYLVSEGGVSSEVDDPEIVRVTDQVFRITFPYCERSNIAVMKGKDGLLMVDTGCNAKIIEKLDIAIRQFDSGDIKYIVNTHSHFDHIAGNGIGGGHVPIISFNNLDQMADDKIIELKEKPDTGSKQNIFDTVYTLSYNDEEIRLIPYPGIHTNEDVLVYFVNSGVVHTGDLYISQSFPSVFQNVSGYLALLKKMIEVFPKSTIFIPGHGKERTYPNLVDYYSMLVKTNDIVLQKLKEGKSAKEIRAAVELQGYEEWGRFIPQLSINYWIDAIVRNYNTGKNHP